MADDWLDTRIVRRRGDVVQVLIEIPVSEIARVAAALQLLLAPSEPVGVQGMTDWGDLGPAEEKRT